VVLLLEPPKVLAEEYEWNNLGSSFWNFKYCKKCFSRCWHTNSSFSIWWRYHPPNTAATEEYDGTSWVTSPGSLSTARFDALSGCGIQTAALGFGGYTTTGQSATEEWTGPGAAVTKTITVS
jgi:hypothetical protein